MKKIVTIQDISCVGKCSLTVALPVISAMGIETAIIPTAVLSAHTAFEGFTFCDLTNEINKISEHWKKENINFSAIYTGYLAAEKQIQIVSDFFDKFKTEKNIVFVDPAMADNGVLYKGFDKSFVKKMANLCAKADIIIPNMTEASFILDTEYIGFGYNEDYIKQMLVNLCKLGCKTAVITGVSFKQDEIGVMSYDSENDKFFKYFNKKILREFHGTGDVFASTCVGALMNGLSLDKSLEISADYTTECIKSTLEDKNANWYGVNFEEKIPYLLNRIKTAVFIL